MAGSGRVTREPVSPPPPGRTVAAGADVGAPGGGGGSTTPGVASRARYRLRNGRSGRYGQGWVFLGSA
ncbi:hypothetical protein P376_4089 [Streptomyces sp. HCCB10043]|nr:hypothetical protein P376_4089 [Streptomyces sp. HCCB10043]EWS91867.1 hypothetical protein SSIG_02334 [Streptomyces filamentosus NRRL 11379]